MGSFEFLIISKKKDQSKFDVQMNQEFLFNLLYLDISVSPCIVLPKSWKETDAVSLNICENFSWISVYRLHTKFLNNSKEILLFWILSFITVYKSYSNNIPRKVIRLVNQLTYTFDNKLAMKYTINLPFIKNVFKKIFWKLIVSELLVSWLYPLQVHQ